MAEEHSPAKIRPKSIDLQLIWRDTWQKRLSVSDELTNARFSFLMLSVSHSLSVSILMPLAQRVKVSMRCIAGSERVLISHLQVSSAFSISANLSTKRLLPMGTLGESYLVGRR